MSDALSQFEARWLARLNQNSEAAFHHGLTPPDAGLHSAVADAFVSAHGFKPIGYNWELLDPNGDMDSPRSALSELAKAIAYDISNPSRVELGLARATECAQELLAAFDKATLTVVSNRHDGLWNPISGAEVEWGFVCYDDKHIALLLLTAPV